MGVMQTGILLLSLGYGASIGFALGWSTQPCDFYASGFECSDSWEWGLLPIFGGGLWALFDRVGPTPRDAGLAFGIPTAGAQLVGLVLLLVGALARRGVNDAATERAASEPRIVGVDGGSGLGLAWDF